MHSLRKSAYHKLTNHIESLIASNVYTPGDKLPTRRELATQFGLTSYAVQQGFEFLEAKGLVVLKHGSGVYVATRRRAETSNGWKIQIFMHILELNHNYLTYSLQGLQEEALKPHCSLSIKQWDYCGRRLPPNAPALSEQIDPQTQGGDFSRHVRFSRFQAAGDAALLRH